MQTDVPPDSDGAGAGLQVAAQPGPEELYLSLLKQCLTRYLFIDEEFYPLRGTGWQGTISAPVLGLLERRGVQVGRVGGDHGLREVGRNWPAHAETMTGLKRLDQLQACVTDVLRTGVPGDLVETGVWRGGSSIFMRAVLAAYRDTARRVWVADSFRGLPKPDPARYPSDAGLDLSTTPELAVGVEQVKANFAKYGLLDDQVRFLVGWFKDTLPAAPIDELAVIRLDGDLYESTVDALRALYPKLSVGGYVIVDDYGALDTCRRAVDDYRGANGIREPIERVDWTGAYWQRRT
jgi:O-methyltransferase